VRLRLIILVFRKLFITKLHSLVRCLIRTVSHETYLKRGDSVYIPQQQCQMPYGPKHSKECVQVLEVSGTV